MPDFDEELKTVLDPDNVKWVHLTTREEWGKGQGGDMPLTDVSDVFPPL